MKSFRNILIATDFSPASRPAFRQAVELAAANGAALWIAHVAAPPPMPIAASGVPRIYREMDAFIVAEAEKRLGALTKAARAGGARARPLLLRGGPHEAVRRAARACHADLVMVGTHGRTGLARASDRKRDGAHPRHGPVPRTLREAAARDHGCPTHSLRDGLLGCLAAGLEASPGARPSNRARLQILHVVTPLALEQGARWAYAEAEAEIRANARKQLQALVRKARQAGVRAEGLLLRGVPREAIVRAARPSNGAWIVVGTHGRTGLAGAFLGSVAARVVATAPCPVLTVHSAKRH